jgi:PAS domain S-box-containing protein
MEILGEFENGHKIKTHRSLRYDPVFSEKELLRINRVCLQLSYQYSVSCYAMVTFDFSLHLVNEALCDMLRCSKSVLLQTDIRELFNPDDRIRFSDLLENQKTQSETSAYCEKIRLGLNGKYIWVNVTTFLMPSTLYQSSFYVLLMDVVSLRRLAVIESDSVKQKLLSVSEFTPGHDNTEIRRPTEESIEVIDKRSRLSNDMLAFAFDQTNEMVFITDENNKIVFTNMKACEFLGYSQSELLTISIEDIAPNFEEEVQMQLPLIDYQSVDFSIIEMYYKTKDQRSYLFEVKISQYITSERYFLYIANDISSRTQIYDMLWHNEMRFVAFVENSPNFIFQYDLSLRCIYVNEAFEKLTGFSRLSMIEKFLSQHRFLSEEQVQLLESNICLVIDSGLPIEFKLIVLHAISGMPLHFQVDVIPEYNIENKISGVIAIGHDITQLKYQEEELIIAKGKAEESDRLKSAFLANMSHEIRTPLNSIIGFSGLLADPFFEEEDRKEFIHHIVSNGNNLLNIISDIMDISKMESGEMTIRKKQINAQKFISDIKSQFSFQAEAKNLELKLILPKTDEEPIIFADEDRLVQIFNNLISNALKFTSNGSIEIGYQLKVDLLEFFVKDTGIGILSKHYDIIFDRFRQIEDAKTRTYGGNGLGLAIAKNLVELMGGEIWVSSEIGIGSVFYFTLPTYNNEQLSVQYLRIAV